MESDNELTETDYNRILALLDDFEEYLRSLVRPEDNPNYLKTEIQNTQDLRRKIKMILLNENYHSEFCAELRKTL